jgi:transposase
MDRQEAIHIYRNGQEATVEKLLEFSEKLQVLEKENTVLKDKLKKITNYKAKPKGKRKGKPWRKWGRKKGHAGAFRPVPDHIDQTIQVRIHQCPHCGGKLSSSQEVMEHIQEDIVPSRVIVTKFLRHRYWCCGCKELVTAPPAADEIPNGYLGPNTLTQMVLLKYHHGLPGNKIVELFKEFCGLKVSEGAVFQALQRLAFWLGVEKEQILQAIRKNTYNHMDETGAKVNGVKHWLWATVNPRWAHYLTHRSRGSKVAKDILGESYSGMLVTDFYAAYDSLGVKNQQKCRVHLRREMRSLKSRDSPADYLLPYKKLKRLLDDADRLKRSRSRFKSLVYRRRVGRLKERLLNFACGVYSNKHWQRLSKRLLKHHPSIFRDLDSKELPPDNNLAERMIRHHVILRNRSHQHRTPDGAQAYDALTSILHSLRLQGRDPVAEIRQAYLHHRQKRPGIVLFPIGESRPALKGASIG